MDNLCPEGLVPPLDVSKVDPGVVSGHRCLCGAYVHIIDGFPVEHEIGVSNRPDPDLRIKMTDV